MNSARGRLKGALQDAVSASEEEDTVDMEEIKQVKKRSILPGRGRPPKKLKAVPQPPPIAHQSYVMKLFDRSVDLAKFKPDQSLYPVCRAWIANQPRARNNFRQKFPPPVFEPRIKRANYLKDVANGDIKEIKALPATKDVEVVSLIPPIIQLQLDSNKDNIDLNYDIDNAPITKADLMSGHMKRWGAIKNNWNKHHKLREEKYRPTLELLRAICEKKSSQS